MKRRTLPTAVALAAATSLLLTACGGGDDSSRANDKIAGVDAGRRSASTPPSAVRRDNAERPKITLPEGVKDDFEGWKTGDTTKDAILSDAGQARLALDYAGAQGNTKEPAMSFYWKGDALAEAVHWVKWFVDNNSTYVGTVRYYDANVTVSSESSAAAVYCSDESKAYNKDKTTGKVDITAATSKAYVLHNTHLEKDGKGVWRTAGIVSQRGHKSCIQ
ncbi:hypothetical protein [Streptomyces sp. NPDC088794]|uniref:hypothetical protein n=1 Tax=Streptomyces sp. NPDC088794 TaxID=3365902 RepID=UPI0038130BC4